MSCTIEAVIMTTKNPTSARASAKGANLLLKNPTNRIGAEEMMIQVSVDKVLASSKSAFIYPH